MEAARTSGDLAGRIAAFLDTYHVMSLATCGPHGPHAANVFYARDGFTVLWISDPQARHSVALKANPNVGATVAPDYRDFDEIRGVQISGTARAIADPAEYRRALSLFEARYPFLQRLSNRPRIKQAYEAASLYRLTPHEIVIIDNALGFGHKDMLEFPASGSDGAGLDLG
jgi:uncharacterized protein